MSMTLREPTGACIHRDVLGDLQKPVSTGMSWGDLQEPESTGMSWGAYRRDPVSTDILLLQLFFGKPTPMLLGVSYLSTENFSFS